MNVHSKFFTRLSASAFCYFALHNSLRSSGPTYMQTMSFKCTLAALMEENVLINFLLVET